MLDLAPESREASWQGLSPEEKKLRLFWEQKDTLEQFLARGAISQAQYNKSLHDLQVKMQIPEAALPPR